tara:strand:- start:447 stop:551 length:105 start_codon:yes stop_codon:yes gene_type:complete
MVIMTRPITEILEENEREMAAFFEAIMNPNNGAK